MADHSKMFTMTTETQTGYLPRGLKLLTAQFHFELEHAVNQAIQDGFLFLAENLPRLSGETSRSFNAVSREFGVIMPSGRDPRHPPYRVWRGWEHKYGVPQEDASHSGVKITKGGLVDWTMYINSDVFTTNEDSTTYHKYWLKNEGYPVWENRNNYLRREPWQLLPEFKEVVVNYMRGPAIDNVVNGIKRGLKTKARIRNV